MSQYGVVRRHLGEGAVSPNKLFAAFVDGSYVYEKFNYVPVMNTALDGTTAASNFGAPTGVTGDSNIIKLRDQLSVYTHVKGTQTILGPVLDTTHLFLDVSQDQTNADGIEWVFGGPFAVTGVNPLGFSTGSLSGGRRFARIKFKLPAVAGPAELAFGFRKFQAGQTALASYSDFAALSVIAGATKSKTQLATGGVTTSGTFVTWADGETHELRVEVDTAGGAYFYIDGKLYQSGAFTFANATYLVPFFFFLQSATPNKVILVEFETGLLSVIDDRAADQF